MLGVCKFYFFRKSFGKKSNKQVMLTFSEKQVDYATTLNEVLDVGSNPYITKNSNVLGQYLNEGGNMLRFANSAAIGISPVECKGNCSNGVDYNKNNNINDNKYWKYDYSVNSLLSPYEVLNFDNTQYSLNESLFFNPLVNEDEDEVNALVEILKNQIVNNGSLYVSVGAYTNLSVEYTPTDGEQSLNANGKNIIYYIPYDWNPKEGLNPAVSVIGWDDNYTHNICLDKTAFEITDAIKNADNSYTCSSNTASVHAIKGAWILQNSWGTEKDTYIYIPYNSMKSSYSSITDVSEIDFDNSYRVTGSNTYIDKGNTKEVISKIKLYVSSYNQTINVYYDENFKKITVSKNSYSSGNLLKTLKTTHPGLYTIDLLDKNIILDESVNRAELSFDTNDTDYYYYASLHTNNVEEENKYIDINKISKTDEEILAKCNLNDNKCISTPQQISFDDNNIFVISGVTRSLTSDDNLTFKVLNTAKEDVTNLFHFFRNFSVSNYINALISYNDDNVELSTYTIEVYYDDVKYDELEWNLEKHNNIIDGIGTEQNPYRIKSVEDLNNIRNHTTTNSEGEVGIFGYYVLENDLDLSYDTTNSEGLFYNSGAGWLPIDNFYGSFNGNNHVISGLYINRPKSVSEDPVGIFGTIYGTNNYIKNLIIKDVNINGNFKAGALAGQVTITDGNGIEINNVSVIGGNVYSSYYNGGLIGGIGKVNVVTENMNCNMYNLYSNVIVGNEDTLFAGGIIGVISGQKISATISDSASFSIVSSDGRRTIGGIIGNAGLLNNLTINNAISAGSYNTEAAIGAAVGDMDSGDSVNITGVYYINENDLIGTISSVVTQTINNNTAVSRDDIIDNDYTNYFEHKSEWTKPEIDGYKRFPMLTTLLDKFSFTEKIADFEMGVTTTVNIEDMIKPDIDVAKNVKYTYDREYLTISSGVIKPKKIGTTTIKIDSLYDGYSDEIQVTIKNNTNIVYYSNNEANESIKQPVYLDTSVKLEKNTFEYKDHSFKNWNTKADGTGDTYTDEQLIEEGIDEELQLYAIWEEAYSYIINKYSYDDNEKYIDKIEINTTVDEFKNNINLNTGYSIDVTYKTVNGNNLLYTGSKTQIFKNNILVIEYTNIIRGDVTGNGQAKMADVMKIATHIIEGNVIEGDAFEKAADITGDGKIKMNDVMKLATFIIDGGEL